MADYLFPNSEIIGTLINIKRNHNKTHLLLTFNIEKEISILYDSDFLKKLNNFIGEKVSIFNLDDKRFFVKKVKK